MITRALVLSALAAAAFAQEVPRDAATFTVAGRVLDPAGNAVARAEVLADNGGSYQVIKEWSEIPWRNWVSDPIGAASIGPFTRRAAEPTGTDGRFRVAGVPLPAGEGWIVVVHPEFATTRIAAKGDARSGILDVGDVVLRPGAAVRAAVRTPDGKPAANASVVVRSTTPSSPAQSPSSWAAGDEPGDVRIGRTGEDGTCVVRGLAPGRLRVASFTSAHVPTEVEVAGSLERISEATITLVPGASLRVEVVSRGSEAPVPGARVMIEEPGAGMSWPGPPPLARLETDAAGVAAVEGLEPHDQYRVTVVPPDFAKDRIIHPGGFHVRAAAKAGATVRVALSPPRTLAVRVLDATTSAAIERAKVHVRPDWKRFDHSGGQGTDLELAWNAAERAHVTTQARPGPWIVAAWAPGYLPADPTTVRAEAGAPPGEVRLAPATASASGRVVEQATGMPVAGASVASYEWVQPMNDGNRAAAASGGDGTFRLASLLGPGFPLRVEVTSPGYVSKTVTWPEGTRPAELGDVALQRAATIQGRVTAAGGRPLAGVQVLLDAWEARDRGKGDGWSVVTGDDGRYAFTGLPPGRYVLAGQRGSAPIQLAEGATVERDLVR